MKKIFQYIGVLVAVALITSCNDFLDVQPSGRLDKDQQFNNIRGFRDAMYGVYAKMAARNLYGENLTYGFADQIGQMFGYDNSEQTSYHANRYDYANARVKTVIEQIWNNQYQVISYINSILERVDQVSFNQHEISFMKGECLGLRAFLHFDLARLYAEDYTRSNKQTRGLPYATTFDLNNKPLYSLHDTYRLILNDLDEAEKLLADDNVVNYDHDMQDDYLKGRVMFFNKFAVAATKARVYYAMGNQTEAARYARQVIESTTNFELKELTTLDSVRRFPAPHEMIFGVYNTNLGENLVDMFLRQTDRGTFIEGRRDLDALYETSTFTATNTDLRYSAFYKVTPSSAGNTYSFIRLLENEAQVSNKVLKGITLIRLPEMYYILSECIYDTDRQQAIDLLNRVRASRGLEAVKNDKTDTRENFEKELLRERMREMAGDGQVFYALKHYNQAFSDFRSMVTYEPTNAIFVLPWPDRELEYGNK